MQHTRGMLNTLCPGSRYTGTPDPVYWPASRLPLFSGTNTRAAAALGHRRVRILALWTDRTFDRARLWNPPALAGHLGAILTTFGLVALMLWFGVRRFAPQLEWSFVRENPAFWAVVMAAYPILSVYPQGVLYRAFFFQRYGVLFPGRWAMIFASAAAFAFLHIIFRNPLAVALTFAGGLLFAARYGETGSLATSSFEHALYGCWLFTIGSGPVFLSRNHRNGGLGAAKVRANPFFGRCRREPVVR